MKSEGRSKIIGILQKERITLTEIAEKTGLKKATVFHHLQRLKDQVKYDKQTRRYSIEINDNLKKPILLALSQKKTREELAGELKEIAKRGNNDPLSRLVRAKDFREQLNDILHILYSRGLITVVEKPFPFFTEGKGMATKKDQE